jgi:site-specific DNA-methyltransferase (adenine-specific)
MFIFTKGKVKTFNPLIDRKNITKGKTGGTLRQRDGSFRKMSNIGKERREYGIRFNIWDISANTLSHNISMITREHPAPFPLVLAEDHIKSWSNPGDTILDCFMGSGTTAIACMNTDRKCIGMEISEEYCQLIKDRIQKNTIYFKIDKLKK